MFVQGEVDPGDPVLLQEGSGHPGGDAVRPPGGREDVGPAPADKGGSGTGAGGQETSPVSR